MKGYRCIKKLFLVVLTFIFVISIGTTYGYFYDEKEVYMNLFLKTGELGVNFTDEQGETHNPKKLNIKLIDKVSTSEDYFFIKNTASDDDGLEHNLRLRITVNSHENNLLDYFEYDLNFVDMEQNEVFNSSGKLSDFNNGGFIDIGGENSGAKLKPSEMLKGILKIKLLSNAPRECNNIILEFSVEAIATQLKGENGGFKAQDTLTNNIIRTEINNSNNMNISLYAGVGPIYAGWGGELNGSITYSEWFSNASRDIVSNINDESFLLNTWEDPYYEIDGKSRDKFLNIPYSNSSYGEAVESVSVSNSIGAGGGMKYWQCDNNTELNEYGTMTHFILVIEGSNLNYKSLQYNISISLIEKFINGQETESIEIVDLANESSLSSKGKKRIRTYSKNEAGEYIDNKLSETSDIIIYDIGSPVYYLQWAVKDKTKMLCCMVSGKTQFDASKFTENNISDGVVKEALYRFNNKTMQLSQKQAIVKLTDENNNEIETITHKINMVPCKKHEVQSNGKILIEENENLE